MTTEIAKCAWCGKEPTITGDLYVYCNNRHCVQFDYADNGIEFWNQHQENFSVQRRKDFHAGMTAESEGFVSEYELDAAWDDYIKAEAKHGEEFP